MSRPTRCWTCAPSRPLPRFLAALYASRLHGPTHGTQSCALTGFSVCVCGCCATHAIGICDDGHSRWANLPLICASAPANAPRSQCDACARVRCRRTAATSTACSSRERAGATRLTYSRMQSRRCGPDPCAPCRLLPDSRCREQALYSEMPPFLFLPKQNRVQAEQGIYECPLYKVSPTDPVTASRL